MSRLQHKERAVKLELAASIARSQHALARILESIADVAERSDPLARTLKENVERLARMQQMLMESATGLRLGKPRLGRPAEPWLQRQAGIGSRSVKEDEE
ncbi:hypothetical protein PaecuDRAFT_4425 [Paenibacillus curdlanolyticus YK9]|uniref:Uncharacterized protein n=1 Tax=Paenibacillus curdlanolyticus YK9 TaxID=717606 RepID=E0IFI4_9BACL|nr:hypothetical protein [Paenibacillus curdlanolyticus]EFM08960.1 hypothetical protein PaecuDRAFT_4425 [Paenibacillus curdlanolyticus YK9]